MTTRQLFVMIATVSVLAAGLAWWLQRFELNQLHTDMQDYLGKIDKLNKWEEEHGGQQPQ